MATIPPLLQGFKRVYLIFDALDECPEREKLIDWLEEILAAKIEGLHMLATSRKEPDIVHRLGSLTSAVIDVESLLADDIRIYLTQTLQSDPRFKAKKWPEDVFGEIRTTLTERANGM